MKIERHPFKSDKLFVTPWECILLLLGWRFEGDAIIVKVRWRKLRNKPQDYHG